MNQLKQVEQLHFYLNQLFCWLENNGWAGWDPYDVYDNRIGMWMVKRENICQRIASGLTSRANDFFPVALRKVLKVKPQINAKAMGLFAAGFLLLEASENAPRQINGEPGYTPCFRWLENHKVIRFGGCGWGYPFDWRSRILIPKNTPTVVNSAIIGDAYWLKYKYHNDKESLLQCQNICQFIVSGLNRGGHKDDGSFCFSYTPVDQFQVHNANLFGAEFLIRIGMETMRDDWIKTGLSAANFSLSEISEDGTLNYWSNDQAKYLQQDTYHSGFEIRALNSIACLTGIKEFRQAADKYFRTWLSDFFSKESSPCFTRGQTDVVEVHSCAEGLLCATKMFEVGNFPRELFLKHVKGVLSAVSRLWVKKAPGNEYFASKRHNQLGFNIKVDIPYIRWGQAWIFLALSAVVATLLSIKDDK
ncbi:MAG: hypothetical protein ACQ9MH_21260 [Nitrospinales bacterium]